MLYYHNPVRLNKKAEPFMLTAGWQRIKNWLRTDTHVLIWPDQEAMVNVSFHQAGFPHTLLSQHHYFSIHTHCAHSNWVRKSPGQDHSREQEGRHDLKCWHDWENVKEKPEILRMKNALSVYSNLCNDTGINVKLSVTQRFIFPFLT